MTLHMEKADGSHISACCEVFSDSEIYERYFREDDRLNRSLRMAAEKGELYIALNETGEIVGTMRVVMRGFCGLYPYLALIGVKSGHRGERIGSFLMDNLEELARRSGAKRVTLMVSDFNMAAQTFYNGRGYWLLGTLPGAVKPEIGELVMIKEV